MKNQIYEAKHPDSIKEFFYYGGSGLGSREKRTVKEESTTPPALKKENTYICYCLMNNHNDSGIHKNELISPLRHWNYI